MYTVESAKLECPKVKVTLGDGTDVDGQASSRKGKFAMLYVYLHKTWLAVGEISWETVVHCLNEGKAIKVL